MVLSIGFLHFFIISYTVLCIPSFAFSFKSFSMSGQVLFVVEYNNRNRSSLAIKTENLRETFTLNTHNMSKRILRARSAAVTVVFELVVSASLRV
jgi:hypothetical protein